MSVSKKPMVLVILDGYGYREEQQDNAIFSAKTPVMDALWANRPHTLIDASGLEVGLPDRQMGNSEVGHVNLGAGRIVYQDLTRLDVEIKDRAFFANPVLTGAVDKAKNAGKAVHIMGLLSAGGVHSHEDHIMAMVELAAERGAEKIYLHAFLDGRDTPPRSAESSLKKFEEKFAALGKGRVASIIGRYYAMDRGCRCRQRPPPDCCQSRRRAMFPKKLSRFSSWRFFRYRRKGRWPVRVPLLRGCRMICIWRLRIL